jgi:hypothetical protein
MAQHHLITMDRPDEWDAALARSGRHDCYHLWAYHDLARRQGEGEPFLFFFQDRGRFAALPLLRRPVSEVRGLEDCRQADATSAYGYPGVVTGMRPGDEAAEPFRAAFQQALRERLEELGVISVFIRQNPLIDSGWMLRGMDCRDVRGLTVAIDLTRPEQEQLAGYRRDHRYDVRRAVKNGAVVRADPGFERIDAFIRMYTQTMDAAGAEAYYYFSREYFLDLKSLLGDRVTLLFCEQGENVISGGMFLKYNGVIQYHLSGTDAEFLKFRGGMKLVIDRMRSWGTQNGYRWLHLGGGLGAQRDSLFDFKAGFSQTYLPFQASKIVVDRAAYRDLVARRGQWVSRHHLDDPANEFFPEYRRPAIRRAA